MDQKMVALIMIKVTISVENGTTFSTDSRFKKVWVKVPLVKFGNVLTTRPRL